MEVRSWSAADEDVVGHSSYCVVGSTLLRFGGFNGQAEVNTTAMRNEDGTWQQLVTTGDLPSPRARAAAVSVDDTTMLVWGGAIYVEGAPSSRYGPNTCADAGALHILDVPARRWRTVAPADWVPPPRQGHTATNIGGGDIIIVGGRVHGAKPANYKEQEDDGRTLLLRRRRYDGVEKWSFTTLASSPYSVVPDAVSFEEVEYFATAAVAGQRVLYLSGGAVYKVQGFFGWKESTELLRLDLRATSRGGTSPAWLQFLMGTLDPGSVVSQLRGVAGALETIFEQMLEPPAWQRVAGGGDRAPPHRRRHAMACIGGRYLLLSGGYHRHGRNIDTAMYCDVFDTTSSTWLDAPAAQAACNLEQLATMPCDGDAVVARHEDGSLVLLGGGEVIFHKKWLKE